MKIIKGVVLTFALSVVVIGSSFIGFASEGDITSPPEILSELSGEDIEILKELKSEMTYGQIAINYGVEERFRESMLENKKAILDLRVEEGRITREEADSILEKIIQRMENCDGMHRNQEKFYIGFGNGNGNGENRGEGLRNGEGREFGNGERVGERQEDGNGKCSSNRQGNGLKRNQ